MKRLFFILFVIFFTTGLIQEGFCVHPAFELYQEAVNDIKENKIKGICEKFQQVALMYPHSAVAMQAQIMSMAISYAQQDYKTAELDAEGYIISHPRSSDLDYVYYLLAMSYYQRIDLVDRDSSAAINALLAFDLVIKNAPTGKFAASARDKIHSIKNYLAAKEMSVGMFYLEQTNYTAAIKRFNEVIKNYKETKYVPEAMYRLGDIFAALNIPAEAKYYYKKVIRHHPNSTYGQKAERLLSLSGS